MKNRYLDGISPITMRPGLGRRELVVLFVLLLAALSLALWAVGDTIAWLQIFANEVPHRPPYGLYLILGVAVIWARIAVRRRRTREPLEAQWREAELQFAREGRDAALFLQRIANSRLQPLQRRIMALFMLGTVASRKRRFREAAEIYTAVQRATREASMGPFSVEWAFRAGAGRAFALAATGALDAAARELDALAASANSVPGDARAGYLLAHALLLFRKGAYDELLQWAAHRGAAMDRLSGSRNLTLFSMLMAQAVARTSPAMRAPAVRVPVEPRLQSWIDKVLGDERAMEIA
ncbi:hypothetical protein LZC95_27410 [Pendulispora brunnea]|uniref:Uncharacterized protein n=1 Tax=Pendulispora brunnea TaxID=2905690 RepID=A0ABZ2JV07_9BACT